MDSKIADLQKYSRFYQLGMILMYLFSCFCAGLILMIDPETSGDLGAILFTLICVGLFLLPFLVFYAYLGFSIDKKTKFVYYGNIVSLAFGLTSIITIVPAILILIKWIEPEVKEYYLE